MVNDFMKLADAVEEVLGAARQVANKATPSVERHINTAAATVEDFFVNNVFDGTEEDE